MITLLEKVKTAQHDLYTCCHLHAQDFIEEPESSEYYAHTHVLNGKKALFRIAKKTPTKVGWFVTFWKRGSDNIIAPYDASDAVDFVVIAIVSGNKMGQFVFPKSVLLQKKVFSTQHKGGKRAMRVYTPWDEVTSAQAIKTQQWQTAYFIELDSGNAESIEKLNTLLH